MAFRTIDKLPRHTVLYCEEYGLRVSKVNIENFDLYVHHDKAKTYVGVRSVHLETGVTQYKKVEEVNLGSTIYFRVVKKNNVLTALYSLDGVNYKTLGSYTTSKINQAFTGVYMNTADATVDQTSIWSNFKVSCN